MDRLAYPLYRRLCLLALGLSSLAMSALVMRTLVSRFTFPYELSKMEGYLVAHIRWLATGHAIYAAPSDQFVPFLYTPFFYWVGAPLMLLGVDGFTTARIISLGGLAAAVAVGMWLVKRACSERWLPLMVPVLFLSRYFDVHAFYDHARADNLMAVFAVLSVAALSLRSQRALVPLFVISGLLAFWTKQSSTILYMALLAGYALISWRVALVCALGLFGAIIGSFMIADALSDGWLFAYTIDAPSYHALDHWHLVAGMKKHMLGSFGVASIAAGLAALAIPFSGHLPKPDWDDRERTRYMVVVAAVATGGFTVASIWQPISMENVLVLYAVMTAFALPIIISWGIERLAPPLHREVAWNLAMVLFSLVIVHGFRNPASFHPNPNDELRWARLERRIAKYGPKERAWITLHGAAYGGDIDSPTWAHRGAICDLVGGHFGGATPYDVPESLMDRIEEQYFDVVLVGAWDKGVQSLLAGRYVEDPDSEGLRLPAFAGYGSAWEEFWVPIANPDPNYVRPDAKGACGVR